MGENIVEAFVEALLEVLVEALVEVFIAGVVAVVLYGGCVLGRVAEWRKGKSTNVARSCFASWSVNRLLRNQHACDQEENMR